MSQGQENGKNGTTQAMRVKGKVWTKGRIRKVWGGGGVVRAKRVSYEVASVPKMHI